LLQDADVLLHAREGHVELLGKVRDRRVGARAGVIQASKGAVVPGARLAVTGYLIRDAATIPKFKGVVDPNTVEARLLRRVDDSFSWGMPPRPTSPNCDGAGSAR